jgi:hypothetical protein
MSVNPNIWPIYSFVQDSSVTDSNAIYPDAEINLPLSSWNNLKCQVQIDGSGPLSFIGGVGGSTSLIYLTPVDPDWTCTYNVESLGVTTPHFPSHTHHPVIYDLAAIYDTGAASPYVYIYFNLPNDGGDMDTTTTANNTISVPIGSCFKFALVWDVISPLGTHIARYYYGCTNLFRRIPADSSYTSVVSFSNLSDAFGYHNSGPIAIQPVNAIELPVYLRDPELASEQKIYTRSDGSNQVLYQRKDEVYTLETDTMPYLWHKALDIALSHDSVSIQSPNTTAFDPLNAATQFVKKENYQIEYNKAPFSNRGKGTCKLTNADPIHLINNNCA